jgi:hypothetical protein
MKRPVEMIVLFDDGSRERWHVEDSDNQHSFSKIFKIITERFVSKCEELPLVWPKRRADNGQ